MSSLVKVKILKNVGPYLEGQIVEVSETDANAMCTVRKFHNGYTLIEHRTAIALEDFEKLKALPVDQTDLTVEEAAALGLKNIVEIPKSEMERPFHPGFVESKDPA